MASTYIHDLVIDMVTVLRERTATPQTFNTLKDGGSFCGIGVYLDERYAKTGEYTWASSGIVEVCVPVDTESVYPANFPFVINAPTEEDRKTVSLIISDIVTMNDYDNFTFSKIADVLAANLKKGRYDSEKIEQPANGFEYVMNTDLSFDLVGAGV